MRPPKSARESVDEWMDQYDIDDDEALSVKEFKTFMRNRQAHQNARAELNGKPEDVNPPVNFKSKEEETFKMMDVDNDKLVNRSEMLGFFMALEESSKKLDKPPTRKKKTKPRILGEDFTSVKDEV